MIFVLKQELPSSQVQYQLRGVLLYILVGLLQVLSLEEFSVTHSSSIRISEEATGDAN